MKIAIIGASGNVGSRLVNEALGKGPVATFSHGWPLNSDADAHENSRDRRRIVVSIQQLGVIC